MDDPKSFSGEIKVASRIVDYLSSGLYQSPAACLKELINNSYDADATRVDVFIKPDADRIIIEDNGHGMDLNDFKKHFSVISESYKREGSQITELGRPKIGKIGIGFIAANEICDVMEIVSTKKGSKELLEVSIRFDLMREDPAKRRRSDTEIAKADFFGTTSETDPDSHFTQVFLKKIRNRAKDILAKARENEYAAGKTSLYGLKAETIFELLKERDLKSWVEFDDYSRNMLEIGLNVPVPYYHNWLPPTLKREVQDIDHNASSLNFSLFIDGTEIKKPIVFNPHGDALISRFEFNGKDIAANGYFYAQHGYINPQELQGVLIRIRNAAVGNYDKNFGSLTVSRSY